MNLNDCRDQIDKLDAEIIALLEHRAELSHAIGLLKIRAGIPVMDCEREQEIIHSISGSTDGINCRDSIAIIYRAILTESRNIQQKAMTEQSGQGASV